MKIGVENRECKSDSHPRLSLLQHRKTHVSIGCTFQLKFHHSGMRSFRVVNFQPKLHSTMTSRLQTFPQPTTKPQKRLLEMHSLEKNHSHMQRWLFYGEPTSCVEFLLRSRSTQKYFMLFSLQIAFNVFKRALPHPDR